MELRSGKPLGGVRGSEISLGRCGSGHMEMELALASCVRKLLPNFAIWLCVGMCLHTAYVSKFRGTEKCKVYTANSTSQTVAGRNSKQPGSGLHVLTTVQCGAGLDRDGTLCSLNPLSKRPGPMSSESVHIKLCTALKILGASIVKAIRWEC